jgi:hypothetical protein
VTRVRIQCIPGGCGCSELSIQIEKISTGTARNGSKYSQVAILNVEGLYQVDVPTEKSELNFTQAFFGEAERGG